MTLLAVRARPAQASAGTGAGPPVGRRTPGRRILGHALALAVLLIAVHLLAGHGALTQADEGAALAQARVLAAGDGWAMAHPLPKADPAGTAFPIERAQRIDGTWDYVPYAKHPVYPVVLAGLVRVAGEPGAVGLSIFGGVLAAIGAALLSRRLAPGLEFATLWCTGAATPLLFYSDVVIAHTLGAAVVAFAALLLVDDRSRSGRVAAGAALLMLACLLRSEAVLLGLALSFALGADAWRRRPASFAPAVTALSAAAGGYLVDPFLQRSVLRGADVGATRIEDRAGFVDGRIDAFRTTLLSPADELPRGTLLGMLVLVAVVAAAWLVHRRAHAVPVRVLLVVAAVAAVARLVMDPTGYIPGLLPAAPLVVAGLALFRLRAVVGDGRRIASLLAGTGALFMLAVSATQYSDGSAGPWGGRYFAVGLPLLVPLAVCGLADARRRVDATTARAALVVCVVVTVAIAGVGVTAARTGRDLRSALTTELAARSDETVISVLPGTGRFQYVHVLDGRWLETTPEDLGTRASQLRAAGIEGFLLLTPDPARDAAALAAEYVPIGEPVTFETTVLGVTSRLLTRAQVFVARPG